MFLHLSVSHSVHRMSVSHSATPPGRYPLPWVDTPGQTPPLADTHCPVHAGIHTPTPPHPCAVHAGIRSTSVHFTSQWNAYLVYQWHHVNVATSYLLNPLYYSQDALVSALGSEISTSQKQVHPSQQKLTSLKNSADHKCHLMRWKIS